ncbi:MAG: putative transport system ATP-binding protein [Methanolobus sp.]|uniref:ABC transporter ATP-binding protein n=1 Tax=Methanolobus sp. TaxID=1874737 RepID=UPI002590EC82|nr:ABC transporter ATP-binding protein [Methanolobus sp.]MDK2830779.1 putative transport system ATP-binding protein [Methanolobus sp.]MDK2938436.1 putative transport system ATP-binding protein [Methanolobus sp.]
MAGCNVQNPEIKNVIDIQGLKKSYFLGNLEVPILHGIDLCIKQGEFVAIMGPSGSGKSTLMNMIGCLDRPTSGKVMLMGKDTNAITDNELAELRGFEIGFVFQNFNLIPRLSAYENVLLPTYSNTKKGMDTSGRARDLLKLVGLDDRIGHKPAELSGGQRQRVAIARSLINDPSLILADEPTGNLDSKTSVEIMDIFSDLHQKGRTIVMITHDPEMEQYVDRVVRIMDGNIGNN